MIRTLTLSQRTKKITTMSEESPKHHPFHQEESRVLQQDLPQNREALFERWIYLTNKWQIEVPSQHRITSLP